MAACWTRADETPRDGSEPSSPARLKTPASQSHRGSFRKSATSPSPGHADSDVLGLPPFARARSDSAVSREEAGFAGALRNARGRIDEVLKSSLIWIVPGARDSLQDALEQLKIAEAEGFGRHRSRRNSTVSQASMSPLHTLMDDQHQSDTSKEWLWRTFTHADKAAAEGHMPDDALDEEDSGQEVGRSDTKCSRVSQGDMMRQNSEELEVMLRTMLVNDEAALLLERAGHFDFDALAFAAVPSVRGQPNQALAAHLLQEQSLVKRLKDSGKVPQGCSATKFSHQLLRFLGEVDLLYLDNSYHNAAHAADVMMTMEWMLQSEYLQAKVSTLDHLMVMVAAAIHDLAHPGRNNLFMTKTMSPLALTYNDKAVLENMHVAKAFETMKENPQCDWFTLLPREYRRRSRRPSDVAHTMPEEKPRNLQHYVRRGLIDMVLATDMAEHADAVRKMVNLVEDEKAGNEGEQPKSGNMHDALNEKLMLLGTLVHAADISNATKPAPIFLNWTERVLQEFWDQGDEERNIGVEVSPLCDRKSGMTAVPKGQLGFISFVIEPFYKPIAELIPEVREALEQLARNKSWWMEQDAKQVTYEDLFGDSKQLLDSAGQPQGPLSRYVSSSMLNRRH